MSVIIGSEVAAAGPQDPDDPPAARMTNALASGIAVLPADLPTLRRAQPGFQFVRGHIYDRGEGADRLLVRVHLIRTSNYRLQRLSCNAAGTISHAIAFAPNEFLSVWPLVRSSND
jgi:hypothetical protein